jgi:hypothetical protein
MSTILKTEAEGFFEDTSQCVASYIKLVEYRKKLQEMDNEEILPPSERPEDFVKAEELDHQCLLTCEKLYEALPTEHALKKRTSPIHLGRTHVLESEAGAGDSIKSNPSHKDSRKKPNLPEFDGKNTSWVWWKMIFEKEVNSNTNYENELKFCHLLTAMKRTTMAHRIVRNYAGVEKAFELAWKDLCDHYHSNCDLKGVHLQALRDLRQRFKVANDNDFRPLEELYVTAQGHVKALEALNTDPATYQTLAIMGLKESLPPTLRIKFFLEHDAEDFNEVVFKNLFKFLKDEVEARRLSWRTTPKGSIPQQAHKERTADKGGQKERPSRERKTFRKKFLKQSAMLQEDHSEEDEKNLN